MNARPEASSAPGTHPVSLTARTEPFDSYWQGGHDLEKGFRRFATYYRANYLSRLPAQRDARIIVLSCGPGYLVNTLVSAGYTNVLGIDSDPEKIRYAHERQLPCIVGSAHEYLQSCGELFDAIIPEQELNHLTIDETIDFLRLCHESLRPGGRLLAYAINGANPLVAPEHISHNIDHFYNVTEYSLRQLAHLGGFVNAQPFACRLYVFWTKPLNYVGLAITACLEAFFRLTFRLYKERASILSKRIGLLAFKPA